MLITSTRGPHVSDGLLQIQDHCKGYNDLFRDPSVNLELMQLKVLTSIQCSTFYLLLLCLFVYLVIYHALRGLLNLYLK